MADKGGYKGNKDPANVATVNNSVSYPGFLNNETSKYMPIPFPNANLTGASGLGILEEIKSAWPMVKSQTTPYDGSGRVCDGDKNIPLYRLPTVHSP